ncbi:MAG: hypothetical protein CUR32_05255 [Flavobacterium sp.]|nr:MAG: hypothetical protein CUR32_05255 [Flavobacterium sp.] [Flavobacterium sp. FEMGT703F]
MENILCKNCQTTTSGNFCSNCGQKTKTLRLDWQYIKDEVKYTILHVNKGFFFTLKELYTRPGDTINEFIQGKRINHYKPILLLFVLAGISGFLSLQVDMNALMQGYNSQTLNSKAMMEYNKAMTWMFSHYALFEILALPIVSFLSWLSFKKWGYNYIENIIINCFAGGQRLVFSIISILLYLVVPKEALVKFSSITAIMTFGLTVWTYASLYKDKPRTALILRILLFLFLLILVFFIFLVIFTIIFMVYLIKAGIVPMPGK